MTRTGPARPALMQELGRDANSSSLCLYLQETRISSSTLTVEAVISEYATSDVCAAELLCDGHDPDAVAFSIIGAGLYSASAWFARRSHRQS